MLEYVGLYLLLLMCSAQNRYAYKTKSGIIEKTPTVTDQPISSVPEPSTIFFVASGIGGLAAFRKKMRK
jgi:hypothetical protein